MTPDHLLAKHRGLIAQVARAYAGRAKHVTAEDLEQEGAYGLLSAYESYDPSRGVSLSAAVRWAVVHAILAALIAQDRTIAIPYQVQGAARALRAVDGRAYAATGRPAGELAAVAALPRRRPCDVRAALHAPLSRPLSLDAPSAPEGPALIERLVADEEGPELHAMGVERETVARHLLVHLPMRERQALSLRMSGRTLVEIGLRLRVGRKRARQIVERALAHVKEWARLGGLEETP